MLVRGAAVVFAAAGCFVAAAGVRAQPQPATAPNTETAPATTQPGPRVVAYKPGVVINWADRQIEVAATVILRDAPIELFACTPRAREHESIVRIEAQALHLYEALGLIGLTDGEPVRWDEQRQQAIPPTGDPVHVRVRYERDGEPHIVNAWDWLKRSDGKPIEAHTTWVFAGSMYDSRGRFAADLEGTVVAIVDFPTALLALQSLHTADNDALWLEPNTEAIPPLETRCTLIIAPAAKKKENGTSGDAKQSGDSGQRGATAEPLRLHIDRFASVALDDTPVSTTELETHVRAALKTDTALSIALAASTLAAPADVERLVEYLTAWGVAPDRVSVCVDDGSPMRTNDPAALLDMLRRGVPVALAPGDAFAEQRRAVSDRVRRAAEAAKALADGGGAAIDESMRQVRALVGERNTTADAPKAATTEEPK